MPRRNEVGLASVAGLLRLVRESKELLDAGESASAHALAGLGRLVHASVSCQGVVGVERGVPMSASGPLLEMGWGCDGDRALFGEYLVTHEAEAHPMFAACLDRRGERLVTAIRPDVERDWERSDARIDLYPRAGLRESLVSLHWRDDGPIADALVFKRAMGDRAFSEDDRALVELFQAECRWVFASPSRSSAPSIPTPQPPSALESFRSLALTMKDARTTDERSAPGPLPKRLRATGVDHWRLVDRFERDGRHHAIAVSDASAEDMARLSAREQQVVNQVRQGHSNKWIAFELGISPSTVGVLLSRALDKLGLESRKHLLERGVG